MPHPEEPSGKPSYHMFHSYCLYPKMKFETQSSDEEVVLLLRAHPLTQLPWIITAIIFSLIPFFGVFIVSSFVSGLELIFVILLWYSLIFSYSFLSFLSWLFNVGIVTNKRVLDFDFSLVLYKEISAAAFNDVSDVTVKEAGFIPSYFNFGNVFVQTAGTEQNIEFLRVPMPNEVVTIINELAEK